MSDDGDDGDLRQSIRVEFDVDALEEMKGDLRQMSQSNAQEYGQGYSDNLDEVRQWYEENTPDRTIWLWSIVNETDYAKYLHDRAGYWVMNDQLALNILARRLKQLSASEAGNDKAIRKALTKAAEDTIAGYTRVVGQKGTRGKAMGPPRPKHKGQWADDTVTLAKGYIAYLNGETSSPDSGDKVADSSDYTAPFGSPLE